MAAASAVGAATVRAPALATCIQMHHHFGMSAELLADRTVDQLLDIMSLVELEIMRQCQMKVYEA